MVDGKTDRRTFAILELLSKLKILETSSELDSIDIQIYQSSDEVLLTECSWNKSSLCPFLSIGFSNINFQKNVCVKIVITNKLEIGHKKSNCQ